MPDLTYVERNDLEEIDARCASLSDEDLVFVFTGLLAASADGQPMFGGITKNGATYTRVVWGEIATRWVPTHALKGIKRLFEIDVGVTAGGGDV